MHTGIGDGESDFRLTDQMPACGLRPMPPMPMSATNQKIGYQVDIAGWCEFCRHSTCIWFGHHCSLLATALQIPYQFPTRSRGIETKITLRHILTSHAATSISSTSLLGPTSGCSS